jgi:DNA-directed RNA polymerase subunit RPC12/RpoP
MTVQIKENKSGSVTFIGKKSKATIPKATIDLNNLFHVELSELILECPKCKSKAFLKLSSTRPKGKCGIILIHYLCLDCGYREDTQINKYEGYV